MAKTTTAQMMALTVHVATLDRKNLILLRDLVDKRIVGMKDSKSGNKKKKGQQTGEGQQP